MSPDDYSSPNATVVNNNDLIQQVPYGGSFNETNRTKNLELIMNQKSSEFQIAQPIEHNIRLLK